MNSSSSQPPPSPPSSSSSSRLSSPRKRSLVESNASSTTRNSTIGTSSSSRRTTRSSGAAAVVAEAAGEDPQQQVVVTTTVATTAIPLSSTTEPPHKKTKAGIEGDIDRRRSNRRVPTRTSNSTNGSNNNTSMATAAIMTTTATPAAAVAVAAAIATTTGTSTVAANNNLQPVQYNNNNNSNNSNGAAAGATLQAQLVDLYRLIHAMETDPTGTSIATTMALATATRARSIMTRADTVTALWQMVGPQLREQATAQQQPQAMTRARLLEQRIHTACQHAMQIASQLQQQQQQMFDSTAAVNATALPPVIQDVFYPAPSSLTVTNPPLSNHTVASEEVVTTSSSAAFIPHHRSTTTAVQATANPTAMHDLQEQQREQMERAIQHMAATMKQQTTRIHQTLVRQTAELDLLETAATDNVHAVTDAATSVRDHVQRNWTRTIGTWTMLLTIAGAFVGTTMVILVIPKHQQQQQYYHQQQQSLRRWNWNWASLLWNQQQQQSPPPSSSLSLSDQYCRMISSTGKQECFPLEQLYAAQPPSEQSQEMTLSLLPTTTTRTTTRTATKTTNAVQQPQAQQRDLQDFKILDSMILENHNDQDDDPMGIFAASRMVRDSTNNNNRIDMDSEQDFAANTVPSTPQKVKEFVMMAVEGDYHHHHHDIDDVAINNDNVDDANEQDAFDYDDSGGEEEKEKHDAFENQINNNDKNGFIDGEESLQYPGVIDTAVFDEENSNGIVVLEVGEQDYNSNNNVSAADDMETKSADATTEPEMEKDATTTSTSTTQDCHVGLDGQCIVFDANDVVEKDHPTSSKVVMVSEELEVEDVDHQTTSTTTLLAEKPQPPLPGSTYSIVEQQQQQQLLPAEEEEVEDDDDRNVFVAAASEDNDTNFVGTPSTTDPVATSDPKAATTVIEVEFQDEEVDNSNEPLLQTVHDGEPGQQEHKTVDDVMEEERRRPETDADNEETNSIVDDQGADVDEGESNINDQDAKEQQEGAVTYDEVQAGEEVTSFGEGNVDVPFTATEVRYAAELGRVPELMHMLSIRPELVNEGDANGWNGLHLAARAGHAAVIESLLHMGADPLQRTVVFAGGGGGMTAFDVGNYFLPHDHVALDILRRAMVIRISQEQQYNDDDDNDNADNDNEQKDTGENGNEMIDKIAHDVEEEDDDNEEYFDDELNEEGVV